MRFNTLKKLLSIQETQAIALEILKKVTDICDEKKLRYFLAYGTLIGAVRHKGFIPWDDDLDIMMPRPDYDKLLEYLYLHKIDNLTLFNRSTCPNYPYMISRISDDKTILEMENEESVGMGVFIDIYPLDGMGYSIKEVLNIGRRADLLSSLCYQATRKRFAMETTSSLFRKIIKRPVYLFSKMLGKEFLQDKIESFAKRNTISYDNSEWVGDIMWLSGGRRDIFRREWFDKYDSVEFEQYTFKIPKDYDKVLKQTYGDYMKLPPEDQRVGHHFYKAYKM